MRRSPRVGPSSFAPRRLAVQFLTLNFRHEGTPGLPRARAGPLALAYPWPACCAHACVPPRAAAAPGTLRLPRPRSRDDGRAAAVPRLSDAPLRVRGDGGVAARRLAALDTPACTVFFRARRGRGRPRRGAALLVAQTMATVAAFFSPARSQSADIAADGPPRAVHRHAR